MEESNLVLLRRKEAVGLIAAAAWTYAIGAALGILPAGGYGDIATSALIVAWAFTAAWVAVDASLKKAPMGRWTFVTLATGPLGFLLYYLTYPPGPPLCTRCGALLPARHRPCTDCGHHSPAGRLATVAGAARTELVNSLSGKPLERSRDTAKQMAIALAGVVVVGLILLNATGGVFQWFVKLIYVLSAAGYWVLVAWWVYLDATWRRMDAIPWAIITLITNVVGLVTYLVIRYPDPRVCTQCGASLTTGLKRCPYCGSEAEPSCPRCQASVRPDWVYCPSCSSRLPAAQTADAPPSATDREARISLSASGTVVDASTGAPIEGALVRVDSRTESPSTLTDPLGRFVLSGLEPRAYVLVAEADGYSQEARAFSPDTAGAGRAHFGLRPAQLRVGKLEG